MSQSNIPNITPNITLTRDDALNLLLSSIAFEELGLAHIINAEGEKIQFALGTLPGGTGPDASLQDILRVNSSVQDTLEMAMKKELLLDSKLSKVSSLISNTTGGTGMGAPGFNGNADFLLTTDVLVPVNNPIPFDNSSIVGTDIMYPANDGTIMLNGNQSYLVLYTAQTALTAQPMGAALYIDQTEIPDSRTVVSELVLLNQTIIRTGPGTSA
ncbi:collagen-like protein [Bacillus cereus]|uniref:collagen-like protein n=1 Tax=Bacillus cereus TaxID=1396 RepID=UPI0018F28BAC|nr:collagen-like protein [Bacillus cereus]MBJ8038238.1 collagen-like protein [Bacillus cereus]